MGRFMKKKRDKQIFYEEVVSGIGISSSAYEAHPRYALYHYKGEDRLAIWPKVQTPPAIVEWLEERAREFGAEETALVLLDNARQLLLGDHVANSEQFEEFLAEACRLIQSKIDENVGPSMQHGQKFTGNRRGKEKATQWLDKGLMQILRIVGPDAGFNEVLDEIKRQAGGFHNIFKKSIRRMKKLVSKTQMNRMEE